MNKISQLLKQSELFLSQAQYEYKLSKAAQTGYYMPDEEEDESGEEGSANPELGLYDKIIAQSSRLRDRELSQELEMIAEMYKKALQINGGYSTINNGISNLLNMYLDDEDNPEYEDVEILLNEIVKDLRARAGGPGSLNKPDKPEVIAQMREIKNEFNRRMAQETMEALEGGEVDPEGLGDLTQFEEGAKSQFDFTAGLSPEEGQKGKGRGYSIQRRSLKDWIDAYQNEKERYEDLLEDADPAKKEKISKMIANLNKLIDATTKQQEVSAQHSDAPSPESEAELKKANQEVSALKKERRALQLAVRNTELEKSYNALVEELSQTRDMREKFLIQQKMELNKLLRSRDLNRGAETKLRRVLIRGMSGGSTLGAQTLKSLMEKIEAASKQKKSFTDYQKEEAAKIREKKQKGDFEGLVIKLKQHVPTVKSDEKKALLKREVDRLIQRASAAEQTTYKPFLEAVANAHRAKDKAGLKAAVTALEKELGKIAEEFEQIKALVNSYEVVTNYRKKLEAVHKSGIMNKPELSEQEMQMLLALQDEANIILRAPGLKAHTGPDYIRPIMKLIDEHLSETGAFKEDTKYRVAPETSQAELEAAEEEAFDLESQLKSRAYMSIKQRKEALQKLKKEAFISEKALEEPMIESRDSDEYAHTIFKKLLSKLEGDLLKSIE